MIILSVFCSKELELVLCFLLVPNLGRFLDDAAGGETIYHQAIDPSGVTNSISHLRVGAYNAYNITWL